MHFSIGLNGNPFLSYRTPHVVDGRENESFSGGLWIIYYFDGLVLNIFFQTNFFVVHVKRE